MKYKPTIAFYAELKKYVDRYFPGKIMDASVQKYFKVQKKFGYYPLRRAVGKADWVTHFFLSPIDKGDYVEGSLAFIPVIDGKVYTIIIDIDRQAQKEEAIQKLLPVLQSRKIQFVYENGGDTMDRCKIWIYCEGIELNLIKKFVPQLFDEAGLNLRDKNKDDYFDEVNPVNKSRNLVRHWLGAHLSRKGKQYTIEINGEEIEDPFIALQKVNLMTPLTTEVLNSQLKVEAEAPKPVAKRLPTGKKPEKFHFRSKNLPLPKLDIEIPALLKPVYRNCQAAHSILEDIVFHRLIDLKGEQPHYGGFFTHRMAAFNDVRLSFKAKNKVTQGQKFFDYLRTTKRCRPDKDHNWDSEMDKIRQNPDKFFPSCKAWEDKFDRCGGCEFKGKISSPKQFIYGYPIKRQLLNEVNLVTPEEVRATTFKKVRERVINCAEKDMASNILVASFQQAGKSYMVSDIAAELGKRGINVLIAVPTGKLAKELADRLKERGVKAFALASHKAIFDKQLKWMNFNCPYYKEIQEESGLGVNSTEYKESYCSVCPFFDICYYPKQYTQVMEEQYNVVIIQHAHLSCQEVMFDLAKKGFQVMFIDESFIDNCYASIKLDKKEITLLEKNHDPWAYSLNRWLRSFTEAGGYLNPSKEELDKAHKAFQQENLPWRVPDLIRYYNQHRTVNKVTGIEVIYELPNVPIKVLTDATPPVELTKHVTGIEHLSVYGDQEVLDYKRIHPENEIIQILDVSSSKSALAKDNLFENELMKIGELCEMKYVAEKALIVTYAANLDRVRDFFESHSEEFPEVCKRLTLEDGPDNHPYEIRIAVMDKGTNKYANFGVQFLQAGVYFTGYQYEHAIYQYKTAANYYKEKYGLPLVTNVFPYEATMATGTALEKDCVTRIEYIDDKHAGLFEYPEFPIYLPSNSWHRMIYEYNVAKTQQAIRVRFLSGKRTIVYVLSNSFLPSFAISKSILLEEFLKPLDNFEDLW